MGIDAILICFLSSITLIFLYYYNKTTRKNYMEGAEHGTARYGKINEEARSLQDSDEDNNILYSKNVAVSMNTRKTFLNNNTLTIGGSGSGKTFFHVKPSALQMNCNYIITDPKDTLIK